MIDPINLVLAMISGGAFFAVVGEDDFDAKDIANWLSAIVIAAVWPVIVGFYVVYLAVETPFYDWITKRKKDKEAGK